jgi:peptide/nickel transport system ATP-binding protein
MSQAAPSPQPPALAVHGLEVSLRTDSRTLVDRLDLELPAGRITGLVGASGSGKTVTALALMGLADPGAFEVRIEALTLGHESIDTASPSALPSLRGRRIAMVFQDPATALDPVMTIGSQLERVLGRLTGTRGPASRRRALDALAAVGFPDPEAVARRFPHELSGGMRQRCAIAMAQAIRPDVLIADEPTTALDPVTQEGVLRELERLASEVGVAVLLISHDLRLMARYADDVHVMQAGRIVERTTGQRLHQAPSHPYTADLIAALPRIEMNAPRPPAGPGADAAGAAPSDARGRAADFPSPAEQAALLSVRDLYAGYERRGTWPGAPRERIEAVRGVSLELGRGTIHGLAGASGCGKSTLARALIQLVPLTRGSVRLDGRELVGADRALVGEARRRIQLVFQDPGAALSPRRTVAQTLSEAARHFGLGAGRDQLVAALEAVQMDADALDRLPGQFSSGQRQRIAIARALICEPDLLVADEALASLDVHVQARILALLRGLRDERGLSILLISHDLAVLRENATAISVMLDGECVETAAASRLFEAPSHPYTRRLVAAIPRLARDGRMRDTDRESPTRPGPIG